MSAEEPILPPSTPDDVPAQLPVEAEPDLSTLQSQWEAALADQYKSQQELIAAWDESIANDVERAVEGGDLSDLLKIDVQSAASAAMLASAMRGLGMDAARGVGEEARQQGAVPPDPVVPTPVRMSMIAQVTMAALARSRCSSGVGQAMRAWKEQQASAQEVAQSTRVHLDSLTRAQFDLAVGGALSQAQHSGRVRTIADGPVAALYADEVLDRVTCKNCRKVHRKWLGNSDDAMALKTYPSGGYIDCLGRWRCRGQVVAVWRNGPDWKRWVEMPPERGESRRVPESRL